MLNGEAMIIILTVGLIKKDIVIWNELFSRNAYPYQKQNRS